MRRAWLPWSLVVLVGAAAPLACGQAFTSTGGTGASGSSTTTSSTGVDTTSGGGMTATTTTTATTTSTSTGAGECTEATVATDCTSPPTVCGEPACYNGKCGFKNAHEGKTSSQIYGDCQDITCVLAQPANVMNDADIYDDANDCTEDLCASGVASNLPRAAGFACSGTGGGSGKVCDGKGACVECTSNTDCVDPFVCHEGSCVPTTCFDSQLTISAGETDVDCGGSKCDPCVDAKLCLGDGDCKSAVCRKPAGQLMYKCIPPACDDKVKNGTETAKDCGGPDCADRCSQGDTCKVPGDCMSGVCASGKCKTASCSDGVKNGNETGVDCGANCPACIGK
jgi:hypothetical protein